MTPDQFQHLCARFDQMDARLDRLDTNVASIATVQREMLFTMNKMHDRIIRLENDEPWKRD